MNNSTYPKIPLSALFAKPSKDQLRISPKGTYLAWRGRSSTDSCGVDNDDDKPGGNNPTSSEQHAGVLNIFIQKRQPNQNEISPSVDSVLEDSRQITFYQERHACAFFIFTPDEKSILYLRETRRGSEHYHLHAIDIESLFDGSNTVELNDRNLIQDPNAVCAMGFVGGIQLWTVPPESSFSHRTVFVSTARRGPFAMFWDISRIDIDTGECVLVEQNIMSTWPGRIRFVVGSLLSMAASWLSTILSKLPFMGGVAAALKIEPPGIPLQWFPDDQLQFRGRMEVNLNLGPSFCVRGRGCEHDQKWKSLHAVPFEDTNLQLIGSTGGSGLAMMQFSPYIDDDADSDTVDIHLCAFGEGKNVSDTTTYERFDVKTGHHICRLASNPSSDISGFVVHPMTRQVQCVTYECEKPMTEILCKGGKEVEHLRFAADLKYIQSFFEPAMTFQILSRTCRDDAWVIYGESDVGQECCQGSPGGYFLFTRTEERSSSSGKLSQTQQTSYERRIELIFPSRPELSQYQLAKMEPVHIQARDGEDLLCFLSSPPAFTSTPADDKSAAAPPPLIMVIHGGPQARDTWRYDPLCQMLCNRGFRTLQVNYRGSTGFGSRFLRIGLNGQFYQSLQNDIVDAATYATKSANRKDQQLPWGDPERLAILGSSFGGYSALCGMTFYPGLYKCAVAICPIASVGAANDQSKKSFGGSPLIAKYWRRVFGEEVTNNKKVAMNASPLYHLDKVCDGASIALYHGEKDPRAPVGHSYRVVDDLQQRDSSGVSGEFVTFSGEGHRISKEANVLYMYNRIEKFLCGQFGMMNALEKEESDILTDKWTKGNTASVKWFQKSGVDKGTSELGVIDGHSPSKKDQ